MPSKATTVDGYLAELPEDRRAALTVIRQTILDNLPDGYAEGMQYGMIGYFVPHERYPQGYHCDPKQPLPFMQLASQKQHMALYLFCLYTDPAHMGRFCAAWQAAGKKLDMGKSCVRFKSLDDVPLDVLGETIANVPVERFIASYEAQLQQVGKSAQKPAVKTAKKVSKKTTPKSARKSTPKRAR